jgi:small conductance mechanosensitive channel
LLRYFIKKRFVPLWHILPSFLLVMGLVWGMALPAFAATSLVPAEPKAPAAPVLTAQDYATLSKMLENPEARAALIQQLNALSKQAADAKGGGAALPASSEPQTIANQLALDTSGTFKWLVQTVSDTSRRIDHLVRNPWFVFNPEQFWQGTWRIAVLIFLVYALLLGAIQLLRPISSKMADWSEGASKRQHLIRALLSLAALGAVGFGILALIYMLGNALSIGISENNSYGLWQQSLFLNAFLVLESARLLLRMILSPSYSCLRLFAISAPIAQFWTNRITVLLIGLGYGLMFAVPIVRQTMGEDGAQVLVWCLAVFGLALSLGSIFQQRVVIRAALLRAAERQGSGLLSWLLVVVAHSWHIMMMGYITMVFLVGLTRPQDALPFIAQASGYTVLAVAAGLLLSAILTQIFGSEVHLKEHHRRRVPMLERRLNAYLPWFLRLIRLLILMASVGVILHVWHIVDVFKWLGSKAGQGVLTTAIDVLFLVMAAALFWLFVASLIEAKLNSERDHMPSARVQTLLSLFRNAVATALVTITAMMVLSELGVNIGPLLAGAGVLGLALGFGAQKLVQDVITGVFIQLENAINKGDMVSVGGIMGTAENLSIRSVGIRDVSGTYHIVPFSAVTVVSNYMRGFAFHKAEYSIGYSENIDAAIVQLRAAFDELMQDSEMKGKILEPIQVPGVTELGASSVNIRVLIKTTPGDQWAVGRAYNRLVKIYFDQSGIEIPFPQSTIHFAADEPNPLIEAKNKQALASDEAKKSPSASAAPRDEVHDEQNGKH